MSPDRRGVLFVYSLLPAVVHDVNHGFSWQTHLAAALFLALSGLLLYLGIREWGDRGDSR
jgi:hypothetical protein